MVDAADPDELAAALRAAGATVLVNAASYGLNLSAMEAALAAGCHYLDLGGLYHMTRRQLELARSLPRRRAASPCSGIGASPGKTNVMAALAADRLDEVHALHVTRGRERPDAARGTGWPRPTRSRRSSTS